MTQKLQKKIKMWLLFVQLEYNLAVQIKATFLFFCVMVQVLHSKLLF